MAVDAAGSLFVAGSSNQIFKSTVLGPGQVAINWSAPGDAGSSPITSYQVSAVAPGLGTQTCATSGALACTLSGLTSGIAYAVSVTATSAAGTSVPSAAINVVAQ